MKLYVKSCIRSFIVLAAITAFSGATSAAMVDVRPQARGASLPATAPVELVPAAAPFNAQIKSYREWKISRIGDAQSRLKSLKDTFIKSRGVSSTTEAGLNPKLQNIQDGIDREELQLSLAQDLTITDYFVGYLTKQKSIKLAIKEVSGRLSAEEVAELMTAYADNFFSSKSNTTIQVPRADSGL